MKLVEEVGLGRAVAEASDGAGEEVLLCSVYLLPSILSVLLILILSVNSSK